MSRSYRHNNAIRTAVHDIVRDAYAEEDARRSAELNDRLGVCPECGKWALKHHAHCPHRNDPVDRERQRAIIAANKMIDLDEMLDD